MIEHPLYVVSLDVYRVTCRPRLVSDTPQRLQVLHLKDRERTCKIFADRAPSPSVLFVPKGQRQPQSSFLPYSAGSSTPILLADRRTRSASSIPMPGLYLSSRVTYVLCARTYAKYCSACATPCSFASGDVSWWKCSRRRSWRGDRFFRIGCGGNSRRKDR